MEDQSSASGSERVSGNSVNPYQPLRKTRLYELGNGKSTAPTASPHKVTSLTIFNTTQPLSDEDYPSKRFRPLFEAREGMNDFCCSPLPSFIPLESPNMTSPESGNEDRGSARIQVIIFPLKGFSRLISSCQTSRLPSTNSYTGGAAVPGHLSGLTMMGASDQSKNPSWNTSDNGDSNADGENYRATFTPIATRDKSDPPAVRGLDAKASDVTNQDIGEPGGDRDARRHRRIPFNVSGDNTPREIAHQTKTFAQLAQEQGFRNWNNIVFDDRWLLRPEEMYRIDTRCKSPLRVSPEQTSKIRAYSGLSDATKTEPFPSYNKIPFQAFQSARNTSDRSAQSCEQQVQFSLCDLNQATGDRSTWTQPIYNNSVDFGLLSKGENEV